VIGPNLPIRIARPVRDLDSSEEFYVRGLGLSPLYRGEREPDKGERDLLMVGPEGGAWHLELTASSRDPITPAPTAEDLLVIYLGQPVPDEFVARAVRNGGTVVPANNPYWNRWGVTVSDPDGYRVVLSSRSWRE
jgi:catechol 2,3-dioxygenase-like lactoylglutathione lyase family enzyme